jgi:hypothetical protein
MLADYRARGGRIQSKHSDPFAYSKDISGTANCKSGSKTEGDEERGLIPSDTVWATKVSLTTFGYTCKFRVENSFGSVKKESI